MTSTSCRCIFASLGLALAVQILAFGSSAADDPIYALPFDYITSALLTAGDADPCGYPLSASFLVGDANGDNSVNVADLQLLVASWAKDLGLPGFNTEADFNCDHYINIGDLQLLVANWGAHQP